MLRFLPNVKFSNIPFTTEDDLDQAMLQTKGMFYGAKLPHGSGIIHLIQKSVFDLGSTLNFKQSIFTKLILVMIIFSMRIKPKSHQTRQIL